MNNETTQGGLIDKMSVEEIIHRPDFVSLCVMDSLLNSPSYWEITLKSERRDGKYYTIFGTEINYPHHKFFKLKQ